MAARRDAHGTGKVTGQAGPGTSDDDSTVAPVPVATCAICGNPHHRCWGAGCVAFELQLRRITMNEVQATIAGLRQQVAAATASREKARAGAMPARDPSLRVKLAALRRRAALAREAVSRGRKLLTEAQSAVAAGAERLRASLARLAELRRADTEGGVLYEPVLDALDAVASDQTQVCGPGGGFCATMRS